MRDVILALNRRIADLERRMDGAVRFGKVMSVDPASGTVTVEIAPGHESPPIPYAQQMGALAVHAPPSVGQQMMLSSPSGDIRHAVAAPYAAGGGNASPGSSADANVMTFGDVTISLTSAAITLTIGGCTVVMNGSGINVTGGDVVADGIRLKTHVHRDVSSGNSDTGQPK